MSATGNTTPHAAAVYDQGVRQTVPFYETLHTQTLDLARVVKPDPACWLDTGCGTGYLVELALPLFLHTRFVLADPSAEMLAQAKIRLKGTDNQVTFLPATSSEGLAAVCGNLRPEVITAVPAKGPAAGNTSVTVFGQYFQSGAKIYFGTDGSTWALATNITFVSSNMLTCKTSAHAAGVVNVKVVNPNGQDGILTDGYTYQ